MQWIIKEENACKREREIKKGLKRNLEEESMSMRGKMHKLQKVLHIVAEWVVARWRAIVVVVAAGIIVALVFARMTMNADVLIKVVGAWKALGAWLVGTFKRLLESVDRSDMSLQMLRALEDLTTVVVSAGEHLLARCSARVAGHATSSRASLLDCGLATLRGGIVTGWSVAAIRLMTSHRRGHNCSGRCRQGSGIHHVVWRSRQAALLRIATTSIEERLSHHATITSSSSNWLRRGHHHWAWGHHCREPGRRGHWRRNSSSGSREIVDRGRSQQAVRRTQVTVHISSDWGTLLFQRMRLVLLLIIDVVFVVIAWWGSLLLRVGQACLAVVGQELSITEAAHVIVAVLIAASSRGIQTAFAISCRRGVEGKLGSDVDLGWWVHSGMFVSKRWWNGWVLYGQRWSIYGPHDYLPNQVMNDKRASEAGSTQGTKVITFCNAGRRERVWCFMYGRERVSSYLCQKGGIETPINESRDGGKGMKGWICKDKTRDSTFYNFTCIIFLVPRMLHPLSEPMRLHNLLP